MSNPYSSAWMHLEQRCTQMLLTSGLVRRSARQVAERLDRVIAQIRQTQAPYMDGERPVDVVLVCPKSLYP